MGAVIRWCPCGCRRSASIRLGPACNGWLGDYTRLLTIEIEDGNVAVIGGLTSPKLRPQERRWIEDACIREGLTMAMDRIVRDAKGKPILDAAGRRQTRRTYLAMPNLRKRQQPSLTMGCNPENDMPNKANTHVRNPEDAFKNGKLDVSVLAADGAHATEQFHNGNEVMLSAHRIVLADGSVIDQFHHRKA